MGLALFLGLYIFDLGRADQLGRELRDLQIFQVEQAQDACAIPANGVVTREIAVRCSANLEAMLASPTASVELHNDEGRYILYVLLALGLALAPFGRVPKRLHGARRRVLELERSEELESRERSEELASRVQPEPATWKALGLRWLAQHRTGR